MALPTRIRRSARLLLTAALAALTAAAPTAQACTSFLLTAKDGSRLYARTMEFGVDMKAQVTVLPRGLAMAGSSGHDWLSGRRMRARLAS